MPKQLKTPGTDHGAHDEPDNDTLGLRKYTYHVLDFLYQVPIVGSAETCVNDSSHMVQ